MAEYILICGLAILLGGVVVPLILNWLWSRR